MEDLEDRADNLVPQKAHKEVEAAVRRGSNKFSEASGPRFYWETDNKQLSQREGRWKISRRSEGSVESLRAS